MSSNTYDFNLPAAVGASQMFSVAGSSVLLLSAPGGNVEVTTNTGEKFRLLEGQGFDLKDGRRFEWIVVRNLQAIANAGRLFAGDDSFVDRRTTGTVQVIDNARELTKLGITFYDFVNTSSASNPTWTPIVQVWNPVGSGKRVMIQNASILTDINTAIYGGIGSVQAASFNSQAKSKLSGSPTGVAMLRSDLLLSPNLLPNPSLYKKTTANVPVEIKQAAPFILLPGWGFVVQGVQTGAAQILYSEFEILEETIL